MYLFLKCCNFTEQSLSQMELLRFFNTRSEILANVELAIMKNKEEIHMSSILRNNFCIHKVILVPY